MRGPYLLKPEEVESAKAYISEENVLPLQEWQVPQDIPNNLLPVEPFDFSLLPESVCPWIQDIAERMQCPPDFLAVGAIVALASVIGRKACIKPKRYDDWTVTANLWGVVVGRPGVMKSPALGEILKPLDRLMAQANDQHKEALKEHAIQVQMQKMTAQNNETKAKNLLKKNMDEQAKQILIGMAKTEDISPPYLRRYKLTDTSVEVLGEIHMENPWGVFVYRDELNGLLRSMEKEGQEGARAFYLQGQDGNQSYTFDRIQRGRNIHIPAVCISLLGGIQPAKLQAYIHDAISGGSGDDGLLQRFSLLVWPDVGGEWRNVDRWADTEAKDRAFETFGRLDAMSPATNQETGEQVPAVFRFSDAAQVEFEGWRAALETELRQGNLHPALESHLSKYRKAVPSLALVIGLTDGEREISHKSLLRALSWAEYLRSHAERAYAAGAAPDTAGAVALLAKIRERKVVDGFSPRDVYLKGWTSLNTPEAAHAAARMLCDLYHLRRIEQPKRAGGGRPSVSYQINPETLRGA